MTTVAYIYHSGFAVITESVNLIFDYWKEATPHNGQPSFLTLLDRDNPTIIFVSHFHKDHFNREVFNWDRDIRDVRYVISKDVYRHARRLLRPDTVYDGPKPDASHVHVLREGESIDLFGICITGFGSTDTGLSYMVETDGKRIFHAGDLNWWSWGDDTPEEAQRAREGFMKVLEPIRKGYGASSGNTIDFLMFPVDPRLGGEYWKGAKLMTEFFQVGTLIPMHFTLGETDEERRAFIDSVRDVIANKQAFMSQRTVLLISGGDVYQER